MMIMWVMSCNNVRRTSSNCVHMFIKLLLGLILFLVIGLIFCMLEDI